MKAIIQAYNKDGEIRFVETIAVNGVRGTGITADRSKATEFDSMRDAMEIIARTELYKTWQYDWTIREVIPTRERRRNFSDLDENEKRFPLLIRAMRWAAILSTNEARAAIRDFKNRYEFPGAEPGGEATAHFGGTTAVIRAAIRARFAVRNFYGAIAE